MKWTCAIVCALASAAVGADWPAFRNANGSGGTNDNAPLHWGQGRNIRWKLALPGPGNSSPIVSGGRVFLTCAQEEGRKRNLYCFDRLSGKQLWVRTAEFPSVEPTHKGNPYCASTPVTDGAHVVAWHGSAGVFCYDFDGNQLWKKDLGEQRHDWGYASSPILHEGRIILNFGPGKRTFLAALDLKTGELLWQRDEPGGLSETNKRMVGSWSTPIIIEVEGRQQILCAMPTRVIACDPKSGEVVWSCGGLSSEKVDMVFPMPVVSGDVGVAFTGWVNGPTIAFKLGGIGDVTASHRLWMEKRAQAIGSGVVVDGRVYIVNAGPGTAQCIDCRTGEVLWTQRLNGGESWGSVVRAGDRLYITSRKGVTTVFRASPEKFQLLAENDLGEASDATPAISDGQIFLRTNAHLFCVAED